MILNRNNETNILIVGLGLMGGSYAKALKKCGYTVNAITRSQSSIDYALEHGIIDAGATTPTMELVSTAHMVVFAIYPKVFIEWIREYQHMFAPGTIITDVTGVKGSVVYDIQRELRDDVEFIAAHPMAGREVYGVENSDEKIFEGANYIVTPTDKNTKEAIDIALELGKILGFKRTAVLSPEEHDEIIAFVSQLAHCLAISLMTCNDMEHLELYTGNSFRDLTRIAKINENMWSELFMMNKPALIREMESFEGQFDKLKDMIKNDDIDGMKDMMKKSTQRRMIFDKNE
ncbi:MAG: prephenate dehydrogenase [Ruminococcaceae bacterium]|nr:prephenate dehydrogenase [Oscillospiraceae bacterium]